MMVRRELYLKRIEMYIGRPVIKLITGVRRSGKTTLLRQIRDELQENDTSKENTVYINFDGLNYAYLTEEKELYDVIKNTGYILTEIKKEPYEKKGFFGFYK